MKEHSITLYGTAGLIEMIRLAPWPYFLRNGESANEQTMRYFHGIKLEKEYLCNQRDTLSPKACTLSIRDPEGNRFEISGFVSRCTVELVAEDDLASVSVAGDSNAERQKLDIAGDKNRSVEYELTFMFE